MPYGNTLAAIKASREAEGRARMTHSGWAPPEDLERLRTAGNWITGPVATDDYGNEIPNDSSSLASLMNSLVPHPGQSEEQIVQNTAGVLLPSGGLGPAKHLLHGTVPESALRATVWHGSPHKFAPTEGNTLGEFDASKIGTGEGAQAYGHGIYVAENPEVAKGYAKPHGVTRWVTYKGEKQNLPWTAGVSLTPDQQALHQVETSGGVEQALASLRERAQSAKTKKDRAFWSESAEWLNKESQNVGRTTPNLYKVDLPDEHINNMLNWDKPLSEQTEHVRNALVKAGIPEVNIAKTEGFAIRPTPSGKQFVVESPDGEYGRYRSLKEAEARQRQLGNAYSTTGKLAYQKLGGNPDYSRDGGYGDAEASRKLREAGIPGIRYLDQGSRGAGQGTSNYVVFDPAIARILGRE